MRKKIISISLVLGLMSISAAIGAKVAKPADELDVCDKWNFPAGSAKVALVKFNKVVEAANKKRNDAIAKADKKFKSTQAREGKKLLRAVKAQVKKHDELEAALEALKNGEYPPLKTASASKRKIPKNAIKYKGHYYAKVFKGVPYHLAVKLAAKTGGYLCIVNDADELKFLHEKLNTKDGYWVQGFAVSKSNKYFLENDKTVPFKKIAFDENQECIKTKYFTSATALSTPYKKPDKLYPLPVGRDTGFIIEWD